VYVLHPLEPDELAVLLDRALQVAMPKATLDARSREAVIAYADGDGRRLINLVEQLAIAASEAKLTDIDLGFIEATIARSLRRFDKGGEAFYDQISALHKAVRGSDPDASLYWLCRMLDGGADPLYVGRRMIRMATEDIGLADPGALRVALDAVEIYERLGTPEGAARRQVDRQRMIVSGLRLVVSRVSAGQSRRASTCLCLSGPRC